MEGPVKSRIPTKRTINATHDTDAQSHLHESHVLDDEVAHGKVALKNRGTKIGSNVRDTNEDTAAKVDQYSARKRNKNDDKADEEEEDFVVEKSTLNLQKPTMKGLQDAVR